MNWPNYYPDRCPPSDAPNADGVVFRLVANVPPKASDFEPIVVEQPHRDYSNCPCQACGVSVHRQREDSDALLQSLGRRVAAFRGKRVATGTLNPEVGLLKATPSAKKIGKSHHTWWIPRGVDPSPLFVVANGGVA